MMHFLRYAIFLGAVISSSCSKDYSSVVDDWKEDGWRVVNEYGEAGDYTHYTNLKSERAKAVEASWYVKGERKTKLFQQNSKFYLVLRFKKPDGDVFAVVLSKGK